eukprot:CAMPEP_0198560852 /NCGR_PEP_ID=MMETSP1462-20131121/94555_1 /TAXON_ID=1333877 /ORGANISM="Brandtodinium nutriculum, Strain RCC3387" /LENGTH=68 /DNA_ID=CAMNT_0044291727 /DNA_START=91 /DNA_END=294 /DNA_ORIENTATION=-
MSVLPQLLVPCVEPPGTWPQHRLQAPVPPGEGRRQPRLQHFPLLGEVIVRHVDLGKLVVQAVEPCDLR